MRDREEEPKIRLGVKGVEEAEKRKDVIIVIDVLRASSTIITALLNGALSIVPTLTVKQAVKIAGLTPNSLLGGERNGLKVPGFSLGNSPLEYTERAVRNRNIVFTTTNCTKVLDKCTQISSDAGAFIGAFLNAGAVARIAKESSAKHGAGITLVQAGSSERSTLDDLACAELIKTMIENKVELQLKSEIRKMLDSLLLSILTSTRHGRYLMSIGFGGDIQYCSHLDTTDLVPQLRKERGRLPRIEALPLTIPKIGTKEAI